MRFSAVAMSNEVRSSFWDFLSSWKIVKYYIKDVRSVPHSEFTGNGAIDDNLIIFIENITNTYFGANVSSEFRNTLGMIAKQWEYFEETFNACQIVFSDGLIELLRNDLSELCACLFKGIECLADRCYGFRHIVRGALE